MRIEPEPLEEDSDIIISSSKSRKVAIRITYCEFGAKYEVSQIARGSETHRAFVCTRPSLCSSPHACAVVVIDSGKVQKNRQKAKVRRKAGDWMVELQRQLSKTEADLAASSRRQTDAGSKADSTSPTASESRGFKFKTMQVLPLAASSTSGRRVRNARGAAKRRLSGTRRKKEKKESHEQIFETFMKASKFVSRAPGEAHESAFARRIGQRLVSHPRPCRSK